MRARFQARQASPTAFQRWFGKGIEGITAQDGQPLTLYHGSSALFHHFDAARAGTNSRHPTSGLGFFLTADAATAYRYGSHVLELHAKIEKPYYLTDAELAGIETVSDATHLRNTLQAQGFDGAVVSAPGAAPYVIAFQSNQVKLTSNQNPTESADFRYSKPADSLRQRIEALKPVRVDFQIPESTPLAQARQQALAAAKRALLTDAKGEIGPQSFTTKDGDAIWVSMTGLKASISKHSGIQKMRVLPVLDRLIENSHFIMAEADLKAEKRDSTNVKGYRYYLAKAEIDGKPYYAKLAVREVEDSGIKRRFYDHELSEVSEAAGESGTFRTAAGHPPATTSLKSIIDHLFGESQTADGFRYSRPDSPAPASALPAETQVQSFQRKIQDKFNRFEVVQGWLKNSGIDLTPAADAHGAEALLPKKTAAAIETARDTLLKPLAQRAAKNQWALGGGQLIDAIAQGNPLPTKFAPSITEYLHAAHAQERNAAIARINPQFSDGGSGLTRYGLMGGAGVPHPRPACAAQGCPGRGARTACCRWCSYRW